MLIKIVLIISYYRVSSVGHQSPHRIPLIIALNKFQTKEDRYAWLCPLSTTIMAMPLLWCCHKVCYTILLQLLQSVACKGCINICSVLQHV